MEDTETDENMQDGSSSHPATAASRAAGKEGSLKHRILSRPSTAGGTPGGTGNTSSSSSQHSDDTLSATSSHHSTPVPSPCSSHSDTRMDTCTPPKKRPRISDRNSNSSPTTPHSDLSKSTNSTPSGGASRSEASTPSRSPNPPQPNRFNRGSLIQLANGDLKAIEAMSSEDFVQSAAATPNLKVEFSEIARVDRHVVGGQMMVLVTFRVGNRSPEVAVEASDDHPFFVLGKGWASTAPAQTQARFGLPVSQLLAGDICISLSLKESNPSTSAGVTTSGPPLERNPRPGDPGLPVGIQPGQTAMDPRIFHLSASDMAASFRRWSAPEDDRFMDNLPPK